VTVDEGPVETLLADLKGVISRLRVVVDQCWLMLYRFAYPLVRQFLDVWSTHAPARSPCSESLRSGAGQ
jgi:hypothetical protein